MLAISLGAWNPAIIRAIIFVLTELAVLGAEAINNIYNMYVNCSMLEVGKEKQTRPMTVSISSIHKIP
jgi:hypothetical protein